MLRSHNSDQNSSVNPTVILFISKPISRQQAAELLGLSTHQITLLKKESSQKYLPKACCNYSYSQERKSANNIAKFLRKQNTLLPDWVKQ